MKAAIVSLFAAGVMMLGACATTPTGISALSDSEKLAQFVALSQDLRNFNAQPRPFVLGADNRRWVVERQVIGRIRPLWIRRQELRTDLIARRKSLTGEQLSILIAELERELSRYDDGALAPSDVRAGSSRPYLVPRYTGDTRPSPELNPNLELQRLGLESTGMRHSEWQRLYRLREEIEQLREAMRTSAISPTSESLSASLRPAAEGLG